MIATVDSYAPGFAASVLGRQILSPLDLERQFSLLGGDIFHGALTLNQLFSAPPDARPCRLSRPAGGLYQCGPAAHPGGGVTGAPGHSARARDPEGPPLPVRRPGIGLGMACGQACRQPLGQACRPPCGNVGKMPRACGDCGKPWDKAVQKPVEKPCGGGGQAVARKGSARRVSSAGVDRKTTVKNACPAAKEGGEITSRSC